MTEFTELDILAYDLYSECEGIDEYCNYNIPIMDIDSFIRERNKIYDNGYINNYYIKAKNY